MENKKTPIQIDGVDYQFEDMTQEQQMLVNHVADLDRKLNSARFNVDQLQVGRDAFMSLLAEALKPKAEGDELILDPYDPSGDHV